MAEALYRLTDAQGRSKHGGLQWAEGVTHSIPQAERRKVLCGAGLLHAYRNLNVAYLRDPGDALYGSSARCWQIEAEVVVDDALKVGCWSQTAMRELPRPTWLDDDKLAQRVRLRWALLCSAQVCPPEAAWWRQVRDAAERVIALLRRHDVSAGEWDSARHAAYSAWYAADSAWYAAYSAWYAAYSAWYAADSAWCAAESARYAAHSACYAAHGANAAIDFCALADEAVRIETEADHG